MTDLVECVVIGAGVVGLAVARRLAIAGREVIVVERRDTIGAETSSRNSEIIHAGIYYAKDSLKAQFCVAGSIGRGFQGSLRSREAHGRICRGRAVVERDAHYQVIHPPVRV